MKIKMLFLALIFLNLSEFSLPENCSIVNNSEIIAGTGKYVCYLYICVPNNIIYNVVFDRKKSYYKNIIIPTVLFSFHDPLVIFRGQEESFFLT